MNKMKSFFSFSAGLIVIVLFISLSQLSSFQFFAVPVMDPTFADLRLITSASECSQNSTWSMNADSCDPWGRPFNYPSLCVEIFSFFNITESHTNFLGLFEITLLGITLSYWLRRAILSDSNFQIWSYVLPFFIFALSPPVMLLAERGNVDILNLLLKP